MSRTSTITVVIPTYNSARTIKACLTSAQNQSTVSSLEIIVVDGGSQDETVAMARALGVKVRTTLKNRSLQRNHGALWASSPWVLFVDSDMILDSGVISACECLIQSQPDFGVAAVIPEKSIGNTFWAKTRALERSFYDGVWWIEAARLIKRDTLLEVGGYNERLGEVGGEDADLDTRLRAVGKVGRVENALIYHDESRMGFGKLYRKKRAYGPSASGMFESRNAARTSRQLSLIPRLWLFLRAPSKIFRHPILFCGVLTIGMIEYYVLWQHRYLRKKHKKSG